MKKSKFPPDDMRVGEGILAYIERMEREGKLTPFKMPTQQELYRFIKNAFREKENRKK